MKVNLLKLTAKILGESIRKPTKEERKGHTSLHYVVTSTSGKVLGYIDDAYINKLSKRENKKYSPMGAAKRRLSQVEWWKEKGE